MRATTRAAKRMRTGARLGTAGLVVALTTVSVVGFGVLGASPAGAIVSMCPLISFSAVTTPASSPTATDGSITVTNVTGGTAPYQYTVNGGSTFSASPVFTGLAPSTYSVEVVDSAGCLGGFSVQVPVQTTTLHLTKTDNDGGSSITDTTGITIPGDAITYTVTVANVGVFDATGVKVNDSLPSAVSFVSDTPSQGTYSPTTGVWTAGTLAIGTSVTLLLTGDVSAGATGTITNTATASASDAPTVTATDTDTVSPCAAGLTAHMLSATYHTGTFTGLFCVNAKGVGTYTQGTVSGTGTVTVFRGVTFITAWGKNLVLLGSTNGTKSGFIELAPSPFKFGTFTLT